MTIKHNPPVALNKEHFYVNRKARQLFHLTDPDFLVLPSAGPESLKKAEQQAAVINAFLQKQNSTAKPVLPAQFHGMKLLHELLHFIMARAMPEKSPKCSRRHTPVFEEELSEDRSTDYLSRFLSTFPTLKIYTGAEQPLEALKRNETAMSCLKSLFWYGSTIRTPHSSSSPNSSVTPCSCVKRLTGN